VPGTGHVRCLAPAYVNAPSQVWFGSPSKVKDGCVTLDTQNVSSVGEDDLTPPKPNDATPAPVVAADDVFTGSLLLTYQSPVTIADPTALPLASRIDTVAVADAVFPFRLAVTTTSPTCIVAAGGGGGGAPHVADPSAAPMSSMPPVAVFPASAASGRAVQKMRSRTCAYVQLGCAA
jgi:hypothetical protein